MSSPAHSSNAPHLDQEPRGFSCPISNPARIGSWTLQIVAAVILGQTLFFKFSGAEEPVYIFTTLGVEPWGRYAAGVSELLAVVLLLTPRTVPLGALLSIAVMVGALGAHLGPLGIEVKNDGGLLFGMGVVVMLASFGIVVLRRSQTKQIFTWAIAKGASLLGRNPR